MAKNSFFFLVWFFFAYSFLCYSQEKTKFFLGAELAAIQPYNKISEVFSLKQNTTSPEMKRGISLCLLPGIKFGNSFILFAKSGYTLHKELITETTIESITYNSQVYYRTIPIHTGLYVKLIRNEGFSIYAFADCGYNIINRHENISQISRHNITKHNGFGYTTGLYFIKQIDFPLNLSVGFGKKAGTKIFYLHSTFDLTALFQKKTNR